MTGLPWAKYIVAAAALMGILTGPLIGFYAGARIIYVLGRERLLPPVFAQMSPGFGTPVVATAVQGIIVCEPLPSVTLHVRSASRFRPVLPILASGFCTVATLRAQRSCSE
jgi:amino acid transporter